MGISWLLKYVVCGQVGMSNSCTESNPEGKYSNTHSDNNAAEEKALVKDAKFEETPPLETDFENRDRHKALQQLAFKMFNIIKEITIMLIAVITYAALTNNPPKISKSPAAFPFFGKDSLVIDYYKGQLSTAKERSRNCDISFVMFYAPWSSECKIVRNEFETVAKYINKQIEMSAINCWQPGSECKRQYSKVYNWPILIAYPAIGKGIQYKGPKKAPYIMRFLMGLMRPFVRITKTEEVAHLLASYDAVILGSVNALPGSHDFAVLYSTALRYLSHDPIQTSAFAIQTIPATDKNGKPLSPTLSLYIWNETLTYPADEPWTPDALLNWISKRLHQITMWIVPPKTKSGTLAVSLQSTPALLLFTPRNPMQQSNDYYDLLHEIALEYNSCSNSWTEWISELVRAKRLENFYSHKLLLQKCAIKKEQLSHPVVTFLPKPKWINSSTSKSSKDDLADDCVKCDLLKINVPLACQIIKEEECTESSKKIIDKENDIEACKKYINVDEEFIQRYETSMLKDENDPKSPRNLQKFWKREKCRLLRILEKIAPSTHTEHIKDNIRVNETVAGIGCRTNRSLLLYALDSMESYFFAEKLGINLFERKDKTAAVIVNDNLESHYILNEPVNDKSLREFIKSYTDNVLPRSRKSITSIKPNNSYPYSVKNSCKCQKEICIKELDGNTFLPTILQDKAVIVMYHSKQCSFCSGISYTFLTVAKIFSSIDCIEFARIDGDLNILPWEYTMDIFPTIIYFPDRRKSESRVFPIDIPITIPNLVSFLLTNLNPRLKLHVMWVLCNQTQFEDKKEICMSSVRAENLSLIGHALKMWRKVDVRQRAELMYRLQQLRNLHLLFAHSPENTEDIKIHLKRLNSSMIDAKQQYEHVDPNLSKKKIKDEL